MMYDKDLADIPIATLTAPGSLVAVWCTNSVSHLTCLQNEIFPAWGMIYIGQWYWLKVGAASYEMGKSVV
jgi:N6-adenosine-specific RNA methylase IME4